MLEVPSLPLLGKWIVFLPQAAFGSYSLSNKEARLDLELDHSYSTSGLKLFSSGVILFCAVTSKDIFSSPCTICHTGIKMPV